MRRGSLKPFLYTHSDGFNHDPDISLRSMSIKTRVQRFEQPDHVITQLQREVQELSIIERDCETLQAEIKEMEEKIAGMTDKIHQYNTESRIMRERSLLELARTQTILTAQKKKHVAIEADRKMFYLEYADAEVVMKNRHFKAAQSSDVLKDATLNYKNIRSEFDKVKKVAHSVVEDKIKLKQMIEAEENMLQDKLLGFKALKEKVSKQEAQLESYLILRDKTEEENRRLAKELDHLERNIDETENDIFSFSIDLNNLLAEIQKSKNENFSLKNDIVSLESKISKRKVTLAEHEETLRDLAHKVEEERSVADSKSNFLLNLKSQHNEKINVIDQRNLQIVHLKEKSDMVKKLSMRMFDELREYVKLDKSIKEHFSRAYNESTYNSLVNSTVKLGSFIKSG